MRGLKGKTVIVTGGAAGIGAAIVERFREAGAKVVIFDLHAQPAVDITDYEAVKSAVAKAGDVDILVNNAGWDMFKPFLKTDPAFWQKIISLNLVGAMNLLHCVLPRVQGRHHRAHQDARARARGQGRAPQRGLPRAHRDRHAGELHAGRW